MVRNPARRDRDIDWHGDGNLAHALVMLDHDDRRRGKRLRD
jgi:hypothetical protein